MKNCIYEVLKKLLTKAYPKAWKAGMERAQCIERKSNREADSQM